MRSRRSGRLAVHFGDQGVARGIDPVGELGRAAGIGMDPGDQPPMGVANLLEGGALADSEQPPCILGRHRPGRGPLAPPRRPQQSRRHQSGADDQPALGEQAEAKQDDERAKLKKLLNMSVNEIELSVRAANCLNNANITTVGQLAMKTEQEMLKYRNFGKKSLNEIKEKLAALNLTLGMTFEPDLLEGPKEEKTRIE